MDDSPSQKQANGAKLGRSVRTAGFRRIMQGGGGK